MISEVEKARLLLDLREQRRVTWAHFERMEERRAFLEWLTAEAPQPVVPLPFLGEGEPWARIVAASRGAGVVVISGDELLWGEARDAWRRALNLGRDRIAELEAPVVILADGALLDEVAQRAPDLWSWRGSVVEGDYEPWRVQRREEARGGGDPLWASVRDRPDLYVPPPEDSAFAALLEEIPKHLVSGSEGCGLVGVHGSGRETLAIEVARRLEGRATVVWVSKYGQVPSLLSFLGRALRAKEIGEFAQEELPALGHELRSLLGGQLAGFARDLMEGRYVAYGQIERLSTSLGTGPGFLAMSGSAARCLERLKGMGRPAVVFTAGDDYHPAPRWFHDFGLPVFCYGRPGWRRRLFPALDVVAPFAHCADVLERRAAWLPSPLRESVARWAEGLPGHGLWIASAGQRRIEHSELTRQDVAAAAASHASHLGVTTLHDALLSDPRAAPLSRWKVLDLWSEAFLRYPPDGGPPYVHPLWLLALGREVDPFSPPVLLPRRPDIPESWEQFVQDILTDPLPERWEHPRGSPG